ncbi:MAG TPA: hypothetical protein VN903_23430 [Polyangia bacterium]|jgi:hypothetical protein|nr:hypothetical protein [Polyangia bacterium]
MRQAPATVVLGCLALAFGGTHAAGAAARPAADDIYAVVVGYNGAQGGLPALRFADDDAVRFSLLLSAFASAGGASRVALLTRLDDETRRGLATAGLAATPAGPATRGAVLRAIADVQRALAARPAGAPSPTFYFVYAGHGLHGRILLEPEAGAEAALTGHELRAAIAELTRAAPSLRAYVFIDACRSQSLFTERGAAGAEAIGPDLSADVDALERRTAAASIGVLTAASSGQTTGEVRALGAGYFSHVLSSGLAGAADADGDELVTFAELAAFVAYNTERLGAQRPWFSPPAGELAAPVVDLRRAPARLELSAAPAGRYLVEAAGGRPILAEAVKAENRPLRLALPVGRYRVLRATPREPARAADVALVAHAPVDAAQMIWTDATAGAPTLSRGDDAAGDALDPGAPAFGSPFTPEAVSTLAAAYAAGREPLSTPPAVTHRIGVAAILGSAPLSLPGAEVGFAVRYRQRWGRLFAGAEAAFGRSSGSADATDYRLDRFSALGEIGPRWSFGRTREWVELFASIGAGGGPVLRRGDGGTSGDGFAPLVRVGGGAALRLDARWALTLDAHATAQWVDVDQTARRTITAALIAGLAWGF